jgi:hypothetical protein
MPCHNVCCTPCFKPLERDRFPTRLPKDQDGNVLMNEEDVHRFCVAMHSKAYQGVGIICSAPFNVNFAISRTYRGDLL